MTYARPAFVLLVALVLGALAVSRGETLLATMIVLLGVVVSLALLRKPWRRRQALARGMPPEWATFLKRSVKFYGRLDDAGRARFDRNVLTLLADYHFEGIGVELTDELRLLAVSGAAILIHGRPDLVFTAKRDVLIYAGAFDEEYGAGSKDDTQFAGMVHAQGPIIFSAPSLRRSFQKEDAYNVSLHEFAHVLDFNDGSADGVPTLNPSAIAPWLELVEQEFDRVERGRSALRDYAGTNHAELFAVAVEAFFERPERVHDRLPELYDALRNYFQLDPLTMREARASDAEEKIAKRRARRKRERKRR